jgi:hypothetical protein
MRSSAQTPRGGCLDRLAFALLAFIGLSVVAGSIFGSLSLFSDDTDPLMQVLVGFLFLFVAALVLEKNRMKRRMEEIRELVNRLLYGSNYERDREAIRILLASLSAEKEDVRNTAWENLKRLTGQDFALDPEVWRSWWAANEKRFALKSKRPEG